MRITDNIQLMKTENNECYDTLEASSLLLSTWFNNNFMKANSHKSHILLSCSEPSTAFIDGSFIESCTQKILLK